MYSVDLTALLLIAASYLSPSSEYIRSLALSPAFISSIGIYVAHLDVSVRRCGMLAAEVVAHLSGKSLDFGDWDGDGLGKHWARLIRELITQRDVDADIGRLETIQPETVDASEGSSPGLADPVHHVPATTLTQATTGYDSDDSITGYASLPSSRSVSPTLLELEEIEKDPTLNVGIKKVIRPVYLVQLGDMLRNTARPEAKDGSHEADRIEVALNCAEELIRKKKSYGTELGAFPPFFSP